jgi:zinc/manganese transport system substrate-binding protein
MHVRGIRRTVGSLAIVALTAGVWLKAGSASAGPLAEAGHVAQASAPVAVVAAENFYGDIAQQLGGNHVNVTSILSDPSADPHEYESDPNDARAVAGAQLVIENGVGYDSFMEKLMSASPSSSRTVVNAGTIVGRGEGENPHLWYNLNYVTQIAAVITADLKQVDPADAADFDSKHDQFISGLSLLQDTMATIKAQYAGTRVAQTEPVAGYMMTNLGISVDDGDFQHAIEEGTDPSPLAVATIQAQIKNKQVALLLYNVQTVSPVTETLRNLAKASHVPVVGVSETLPPSEGSYQQWMVDQLNQLQQALAAGTGS